MKVFAKDGTVGEGGAVTSTTAVLEDLGCEPESRTLVPTAADIVLTPETPFVPITRR
jgi:hypothetical protein